MFHFGCTRHKTHANALPKHNGIRVGKSSKWTMSMVSRQCFATAPSRSRKKPLSAFCQCFQNCNNLHNVHPAAFAHPLMYIQTTHCDIYSNKYSIEQYRLGDGDDAIDNDDDDQGKTSCSIAKFPVFFLLLPAFPYFPQSPFCPQFLNASYYGWVNFYIYYKSIFSCCCCHCCRWQWLLTALLSPCLHYTAHNIWSLLLMHWCVALRKVIFLIFNHRLRETNR